MNTVEKKRLIIFTAIAFGFDLLMCIPMWIGLSRNNVRLSALFVALYIVLFYGQMYISLILQILFYGADGDIITNFTMSIFNVGYIRSAAFLLAIFPISFIGYLGEEYGWRYYLQPILQKKYGLRAGVVILGIVWGLWHV